MLLVGIILETFSYYHCHVYTQVKFMLCQIKYWEQMKLSEESKTIVRAINQIFMSISSELHLLEIVLQIWV
jgi:hypothetical protein